MSDRFKRVIDFYGTDGFARIRKASIFIAGLGGVGSHCASALARSGTGRLYLADFDTVTESSLNRNPLLSGNDIGKLKVNAMAELLRAGCPDTSVIPVERFLCSEDLLEYGIPQETEAVADAIDSLNPKTQLLQFCCEKRIPVFSSMGAAGKRLVPSIRTGDISESGGCPLAKMTRKYLRRRGVTSGITCVWSIEKALEPLPPDDEPRLERRGRIRNSLPSLITIPGIFGYTLAQLILDRITQLPERE